MWTLLLALPLFAAPTPAARVTPDRLPAGVDGTAQIEVMAFGRYAISTQSETGARFVLVDRAAGPGDWMGEPGKGDGRVDRFLEPGTLALRTAGIEGARGEIAVQVRPFVEQNPASALLVPGAALTTTLEDLQQRTWTIEATRAARLELELAGPGLSDLRLWRDGAWMSPSGPVCDRLSPPDSAPLRRCTLDAALEPGRYTVVAYGGPLEAGATAAPLHLRWGMPTLGTMGEEDVVIGPFGLTRLRVPEGPELFVASLPQMGPLGLSIGPDSPGQVFTGRSASLSLRPDARLPVLSLSQGGKQRVLTVQGRPGATVRLAYSQPVRGAPVAGRGTVNLLAYVGGEDGLDLTALILAGDELLAVAGEEVGPRTGLRRRFTLSEKTDMIVTIAEEGDYRVELSGEGVSATLSPLATPKGAAGLKPPETLRGRSTLRLSPGGHALSVSGPAGVTVELVVAGVDAPSPPLERPRRVLQLDGLQLRDDRDALVAIPTQGPDRPRVLVVRPVVDPLTRPMPVYLEPGAVVSRRLNLAQAGLLQAPISTTAAAELRVDGGAWGRTVAVSAGTHAVELRLATPAPAFATLRWSPPEEPPARLPKSALPLLEAGRPLPFDLGPEEALSARLRVTTPGLYLVESAGLLATAGSLRGRASTELTEVEGGGPGRNFRIARYLPTGEYLVTVRTLGASAGHGSLHLRPVPLREGGTLGPGEIGRAALAAEEGLAYTLQVPKAGAFRIEAGGPAGAAGTRLEDPQGWPLTAVDSEGELRFTLAAGAHRLILLPEPEPRRRAVAFSEEADDSALREGHGPFGLALGEAAHHTWRESTERSPDRWTFSLLAPATLRLQVSGEMAGRLLRGEAEVARIPVGVGLEQALPAGDYTVELRQARRSDAVPYAIEAVPVELVAGARLPLRVDAPMPVSIGEAGLYQLSTAGPADTQLRLTRDGVRLGEADDAGGDWNSQLLLSLEPGRYEAHAAVLSGPAEGATVALRRLGEPKGPSLAPGAPVAVTAGEGLLLLPLTLPTEGLFALSAQAAGDLGLRLERAEGAAWVPLETTLGSQPSLTLRAGSAALRARLWSLDGRPLPATVQLRALRGRSPREGAVENGVDSGPLVIGLDRPGAFTVRASAGAVSWCPQPSAPCQPIDDKALPAAGALYLIGPETGRLWARRVQPLMGTPLALAGVGAVSLEGEGPLLVTASATAGPPGLRLQDRRHTVEAGARHPDRLTSLLLDGRDATATLTAPAAGGSLTFFRLRPPIDAPAGATSGLLGPGQTLRMALPPGAHRVVAPAGIAVGLLDGERVTGLLFEPDTGVDVVLDPGPTALLFANPGREALPVRMEASSAGPGALVCGAPIERIEAEAGRRLLRLPEGPGTLVVEGAQATLLGDDGVVQLRGPQPFAGGTLVIDHPAGPWSVACLRAGQEAADAWGPTPRAAPQATALPARLPLGGEAMALRLESRALGLLRLRLEAPTWVELQTAAGPGFSGRVGPGTVHLPLPAGAHSLHLRGWGGEPLRGALTLDRIDPVGLSEGAGPVVALGEGQAAAFRLDLPAAQPVGLGLRGSADGAELFVYAADGTLLGRGPALLPTLPAGASLLVVQARGRPLSTAVVVTGTQPRPPLPPEDVLRTYREAQAP